MMKTPLSHWIVFLLVALVCSQWAVAGVSKKRFDFNDGGKVSTTLENVGAENPALENGAGNGAVAEAHAKAVKRDDRKSYWESFAHAQKSLREKLTASITAMKGGDWGVIWAFLAICFVYGMLHALGPGHGKSIVVGYFLARRGGWRQGIALGAGITFAHTLSAVVLLFALYAFFKAAVFPAFEMGREGIEKVSYGLVMLTGILLMALGLREALRKRGKDREGNSTGNSTWKEIMAVAAVTGVVPCPAVALIVLFCLLNSLVALSLLSAVAICLGMTLTNIAFGVAAIAMRKGIDKGASKTSKLHLLHLVTTLGGGLVIFVSGLLLFCNTFAGRC